MLNVYLSGEIHTDWRNEIVSLCNEEGLKLNFPHQLLITKPRIIVE